MKQKGFTLIEVMIVVSIAGILLAVGVDAYQNMGNKQHNKKVPTVATFGTPKANVVETKPVQEQCVHGYVIVNDKQLLDDKGHGVRCY